MVFRTLAGKEKKEKKEILEDIVFEVIKRRRSVRKYKSDDISDANIQKILTAASYAPSAGNHQPWEFIVVRDENRKKEISEIAFNQHWIAKAPVMIVACINMRLAKAVYGERGEKLYGIQSVAAAIENMLIMAEALGIGTCWVGGFSEPKLSIFLGLPDYIRSCAIITFGYPDEKPRLPEKENLSDFVHYERFEM